MRRSALILVGLLIVAMPLQGASQSNTDGRADEPSGSLVGDACRGKSFEWLFVYSHAIFTIDIGTEDQNGQWAWTEEANAFAEAWVNDSFAPELRKDVDELVGGFTGVTGDQDANDSYLGSDEIEFITGAGPECLSEVETRVAVTPSWSDGEEWNNITWVKPTTQNPDTIVVIEENGVPAGPDGDYGTEDDPDELQPCSQNKNNCWEYPTDAKYDEEDIYLNMTGQMEWRGLNDASSFTMLLNGTPNATYVINIPQIPNLGDNESLELVYWTVHDPITGFAEATEPTTTVMDDGRTRITVDMVPGVWELRFDTGSEVSWSNGAPLNTTMFHANAGNDISLVDAVETSSWFGGSINMLNAQCTAPTGWSATLDLNDGFKVTVPASATEPVEVTCSASETSGERIWLVGPLFTASIDGDTIAIVSNAPEGRTFDLQYALGSSTERKTSWKFASGPIDTTGVSRGTHSIWFSVLGPEHALVRSSSFISDLTYTVANKAPTVEQVTAAWDSKTVTLTIQVNDPEGGEVTVKPYIGDTPYTAKRGSSVIGIDMDLSDLVLETNITVRIEICDDENSCITHEQTVDASHLAVIAKESGSVTTEDVNKVLEDSTEGGVPAPGLTAVLMGFAGALIAVQRRERSQRD